MGISSQGLVPHNFKLKLRNLNESAEIESKASGKSATGRFPCRSAMPCKQQKAFECFVCCCHKSEPWLLVEHMCYDHGLRIYELRRIVQIPNWHDTEETFSFLYCPICKQRYFCRADFYCHMNNLSANLRSAEEIFLTAASLLKISSIWLSS
uniref:C2H2-type domain-containing protein n=1 Tax=Trichuris muris TaxID=70415 RepID=A0A5S6QDF9_TRIMR